MDKTEELVRELLDEAEEQEEDNPNDSAYTADLLRRAHLKIKQLLKMLAVPSDVKDAICAKIDAQQLLKMLAVPSDVKDAICAKIDAQLKTCSASMSSRDEYCHDLLAYYVEHGEIADVEIYEVVLSEVLEDHGGE